MLKFIVRLAAAIGLFVAISSSADAQSCTSFPYNASTGLANGQVANASGTNGILANFTYFGGCAASIASPSFTGNVGIGTTSPLAALQVVGSGSSDAIFATSSTYNTSFGILPSNGNAYISIGAAYQSGNWIQQNNAANAADMMRPVPGTGMTWYAESGVTNGNPITSWNVASGVGLWTDAGAWTNLVQSTATGNSYFTGGDVGIGTTSPLDLLGIYGTSDPSAGFYNPTWSAGEYSTLVFRHGATVVNGSNNAAISEIRSVLPGGGNSDLRFYTTKDLTENANPIMVVTGSGDVGIGTASPAQALEVDGKVQVDSLGSAAGTSLCISATTNGVLSTCSSSIRYKENVRDAPFGLNEVMKMRPVTFKWKGRDENDLGLIAEEVAKINPLFATYKDGKIEGVKYAQLTVVLAGAIKELKSANDKLANQLSEKTAQIEHDSRELADLKRENALLKSSASATDRRLEAIEARLGIRAASLDHASGRHE